MNRRANVLVNTMIVLSFTSLVFLSMARSNDRVHQIETKVFDQNVPESYMDYTLELLDEDMDEHFDYFINNPTEYDSARFKQILNNRVYGITGFYYKSDDVSDNELDFWQHVVQIARNNGYSLHGVDKYVIGIDLPNYKGEYQIDIEFEKTWEYKRNYLSDWIRCSWFNKRGACKAITNPRNYSVEYSVSDNSRGKLKKLEE